MEELPAASPPVKDGMEDVLVAASPEAAPPEKGDRAELPAAASPEAPVTSPPAAPAAAPRKRAKESWPLA